jgi:hypothetical protein
MLRVNATMATITQSDAVVGIVSQIGKERPPFEMVRLDLGRRSAFATDVIVAKQHRVSPSLVCRAPNSLRRLPGIPSSRLCVLAFVGAISPPPRNLGRLCFEHDAAFRACHLDGTGPERLSRPSGMVATLGAVEAPASLGSISVRQKDCLAVGARALDLPRPVFREAPSRTEARPSGFSVTRECGERLPAAVAGDRNHRRAGHDSSLLSLAIIPHVKRIRKVG